MRTLSFASFLIRVNLFSVGAILKSATFYSLFLYFIISNLCSFFSIQRVARHSSTSSSSSSSFFFASIKFYPLVFLSCSALEFLHLFTSFTLSFSLFVILVSVCVSLSLESILFVEARGHNLCVKLNVRPMYYKVCVCESEREFLLIECM